MGQPQRRTMITEAVVFDVGGVIVRTQDLEPRSKWEKRLGLGPWGLAKAVFESDTSYRASIGKAAVSEIWRDVGARFGLGDSDVAALQRDFWAGDRVDQELVAFIRSLRPQYKTALLTNAWPDARQVLTNRYHLDVVDTIVISAEEGVLKPDPRIYQIALARLGVQADRAVFVDDVMQNVEGARAIGMRAMRFDLSSVGSTAAFVQLLEDFFSQQGT